ncbi:hypothetical protein [Micromonospora echinaurantiaca]|uniref:hypothetical protein n=1 Tax=Micromonospora echinaurantiaca TaxID=47857 RepID=UPI001E3A4B6B|nr:hypothetical protein [Micromonospora echinaurantiaca]
MDPYILAEVDQGLDWIHWHHDEFDYRHIYFAYLAVRISQPHGGEVTVTIGPDGSYLLQAGDGESRLSGGRGCLPEASGGAERGGLGGDPSVASGGADGDQGHLSAAGGLAEHGAQGLGQS